MSNLKEARVKVTTSEGAFGSEYAIQIKCFDGKSVSLFADKRNVEASGGASYMKVFVVNDSNQKVKRVLLPSEAFETSSRWVEVAEAQVK